MFYDPRLPLIFIAWSGVGWGHENVVSNKSIMVTLPWGEDYVAEVSNVTPCSDRAFTLALLALTNV